MARASVTTQQVTRTGLNPALTAPPADGDIVDCGRVALMVTNGSGSPITVTVEATAAQDGLDVADLVVSVPASGTRLIGPLPARTFGQPYDSADAGRAFVDYSAVASVTRAVITI
ncbi:hypothetical protein ACIA59_10630 [Micromonospora haikouensis]|uniref:hypothetical protein n=1 Tax=Micromonospora haikouensis TaxID=686309 RepID=UPI0037B19542